MCTAVFFLQILNWLVEMVRVKIQDIDGAYEEVKRDACGRQACSVMILCADEVRTFIWIVIVVFGAGNCFTYSLSQIDAMASTRMLTQLLRADNIAYTYRFVSNVSQLKHHYDTSRTADIKSLFLINCGAVSAHCLMIFGDSK